MRTSRRKLLRHYYLFRGARYNRMSLPYEKLKARICELEEKVDYLSGRIDLIETVFEEMRGNIEEAVRDLVSGTYSFDYDRSMKDYYER